MTQNPHPFHQWEHTPEGLKLVKQQPSNVKRQGRRNQQPPPQQGASRHKAGHHAGLHPEDNPYLTNPGRPRAQQGRRTQKPVDYDSVLVDEEEGDGDYWPQKLTPMSQIRYDVDTNGNPIPGVYRQGNVTHRYHGNWHGDLPQSKRNAIPPRGHTQTRIPPQQQQDDLYEEDEELESARAVRARPIIKLHWLVYAGLALCLLIGSPIAVNVIGTMWQNHTDDVTYGMPRTFQTDAVVGHGDSSSNPSHFIAINLRGSIWVIEAPGGDYSKARQYFITTEVNQNPYPPVTVKFEDLTHSGRLDMVVTIGDPPTPLIVFLFNNGSQFLAKQK
jgi:hypothetical protein